MRILLTASGAQGSYEIINEFHKQLWHVHGVDLNPNVIGRFESDEFTQVPPSDTDEYVESLIEICHEDDIDVVFPQSDLDVIPLSKHRDEFPCKVMVSSLTSLQTATNKYKVYSKIGESDIVPEYRFAKNQKQFVKCSNDLGYNEGKKIVCRLPKSKGGRGMFILSQDSEFHVNKKDVIPNIKLNHGLKYLENCEQGYLLTEFVVGEEVDSMTICRDGETYLTTHKLRLKELAGTIVEGKVVDRPQLDKKVQKVISKISLSHNISVQFKGGKLIEINPRSSTYINSPNFSEAVLAVKLAMGILDNEKIKKQEMLIPYGMKMIRYMRQVQWQ